MEFKNNEERIKFLDKKAEEIKANQEADLTYDFDAALKEYNSDKSFKVKFLDKIYSLPVSMPFNFSTFFLRNCYKKVDGKMVFAVQEEHLYKFIELMFGRQFLSALERSTVTMGFVFDKIVPDVLTKWGYDISTKDNAELQKKMKMLGL